MTFRNTIGTAAVLSVALGLMSHAAAPAPIAIQLVDWLQMPITGSPTGTSNNGSLARINVMRDEPGGRRFFVNDLNGLTSSTTSRIRLTSTSRTTRRLVPPVHVRGRVCQAASPTSVRSVRRPTGGSESTSKFAGDAARNAPPRRTESRRLRADARHHNARRVDRRPC